MKRENWTLIAICSAKNRGLSPVQLQKTLFLMGQELPQEVGYPYYNFVPYNYGPFDAQIYTDAESLAKQGLVAIESSSAKRWSKYLATSFGLKSAEQIKQEVSPCALQYLQTVIDWVQDLSFQQLVRAIYKKYPQYRANSVFQDNG